MKLFKHSNLVLHIAIAAALSAPASLAHANSFSYSLLGVTTSAGTLSGTVSIDSATSRVTSASITFNDTLVGSPFFNNIGSPNAYNGLGQDYISGLSNSSLNYGGQFALYYDTAGIGTGDLGICLATGACGTETNQASFVQVYASNSNGGPYYITGGKLSLLSSTVSPGPSSLMRLSSAVTPEPSSLILLGTGILGLAVLVRWKFGNL